MTEQLAPVLVSLFFFTLFGFCVWVVMSQRTRRVTAHIDLQSKLLERFGSSREFVEFLNTEAGRRFLEGTATGRPDPFTRVLTSVQAGVIMSCLGLGLAVLAFRDDDVMGPATVVLALGIGILLAALVVSRMSRRRALAAAGQYDPARPEP